MSQTATISVEAYSGKQPTQQQPSPPSLPSSSTTTASSPTGSKNKPTMEDTANTTDIATKLQQQPSTTHSKSPRPASPRTDNDAVPLTAATPVEAQQQPPPQQQQHQQPQPQPQPQQPQQRPLSAGESPVLPSPKAHSSPKAPSPKARQPDQPQPTPKSRAAPKPASLSGQAPPPGLRRASASRRADPPSYIVDETTARFNPHPEDNIIWDGPNNPDADIPYGNWGGPGNPSYNTGYPPYAGGYDSSYNIHPPPPAPPPPQLHPQGPSWRQQHPPSPTSPKRSRRSPTFPTHGHLPAYPPEHPPTGYELLAAKLSGYEPSSPIQPIYRRFEALNHRIMLGLQDELTTLEEKLRRLDETDSESRVHLDGYLPASRRLEAMDPTELTDTRQQLISTIAYQLFQYNTQINAIKTTAGLGVPSAGAIAEYKEFLAQHGPIVPTEARFLDREGDLVCLYDATIYPGKEVPRAGMATPTPERMFKAQEDSRPPRDTSKAVQYAALGALGAIGVPMLAFQFIPWFIARMTIVLLVGLFAFAVLTCTGTWAAGDDGRNPTDKMFLAVVYGLVMAIIAGTSL